MSAESRAHLDSLFRTHRTAWLRFACGLVGESEAEELVHDALAKVWTLRLREEGESERQFGDAYVRAAIRNLSRDRARSSSRRRELMRGYASEVLRATSGTVEWQIERILANERRALIERQLAELPSSEERALRLFYLNELDPREVAERTGWTVASAMSIRSRALKRLRDLGGELEPPAD